MQSEPADFAPVLRISKEEEPCGGKILPRV
jgi:hypothetical protein